LLLWRQTGDWKGEQAGAIQRRDWFAKKRKERLARSDEMLKSASGTIEQRALLNLPLCALFYINDAF
jgi:hypothetical protein